MWTVPSHASLFTGLAPSTHGARFDHRWLDAHRVTLAEWFGRARLGHLRVLREPEPVAEPGQPAPGVRAHRHRRGAGSGATRSWPTPATSSSSATGAPRSRRAVSRNTPAPGFYNAGPDHPRGAHVVARHARRPGEAVLRVPVVHGSPQAAGAVPREPPEGSRRTTRSALGLAPICTFKNQLLYGYGKVSYTPEELEAINRVYDATLVDLDNATGDLLDDLEERGVLDDTIVVFTADHGEQLGEHEQFGHRSGLYQTLLHVPLVVAYPRKLTPRRVEAPVSNLSAVPTPSSSSPGSSAPETPDEFVARPPATRRAHEVFSETMQHRPARLQQGEEAVTRILTRDRGRTRSARCARTSTSSSRRCRSTRRRGPELRAVRPRRRPARGPKPVREETERASKLIAELDAWKSKPRRGTSPERPGHIPRRRTSPKPRSGSSSGSATSKVTTTTTCPPRRRRWTTPRSPGIAAASARRGRALPRPPPS